MTEVRGHARNGLEDVEFELSEMNGSCAASSEAGRQFRKRGYYEVHLLADGASIMSLTAGGLSSVYPQPGIHEFLTSGRRVTARAR